MAVWWKPLALLPLLFACTFAKPSSGKKHHVGTAPHPLPIPGATNVGPNKPQPMPFPGATNVGPNKPQPMPFPGATNVGPNKPQPMPFPGATNVGPNKPQPMPFPGATNVGPNKPQPMPFPGATNVGPNKPQPMPFPGATNVGPNKPDLFETKSLGEWKLDNPNAGVSAMQLQLMPTGNVVWFDTTGLGPSAILNNPPFCRELQDGKHTKDCFSHAIEYNPRSSTFRTMKFHFDPWCSGGGLAPNGDLVSTGGAPSRVGLAATRAVRLLSPTPNAEYRENPNALAGDRWYASQQILEDGSFMVVGGRGEFTYELIPPSQLQFPTKKFDFPFLRETDTPGLENNLYPFLHLLPDGNVFVFANSKSLILDAKTNRIIRRLPELPGGSRNYPSSGMSALLPLDLRAPKLDAEVIVCGGNVPEALRFANMTPPVFLPALNDCNRLVVTNPNAQWDKEIMPSPRVMGDMLILPNGDLLMINGAKKGCSAWYSADEPNLTPVLYSPNKPKGQRMKELAPTTIPRMYHAASAVLPEGSILLAGSNPNEHYNFTVKYPTELRVEKFSPPYLAKDLEPFKPRLAKTKNLLRIKYGQPFDFKLRLRKGDPSALTMTLYSPPFTTHGFSQNQRMLVFGLTSASGGKARAVAPPSPKVAPPGYYLMFAVHKGVPSNGIWVHLQ